MKKRLFFILLIFITIQFSQFAQNEEAEISSFVPVYDYNIENQFNIKKAGTYYIKFFNTSNIPDIYNGEKKEFIKKQMIEKLHKIYEDGSSVYIDGPVAYLYYENIILSKENIDAISDMVKSIENKMVCVDISNCYFENYSDPEKYGLPEDSFMNLDNLYWLYLGDMLNSKLPSNLCQNCSNLMTVYVWNESGIKENVFENVSPETEILTEDMTAIYCSDYLQKFIQENSEEVLEIEKEISTVTENQNDLNKPSYTYTPVSTGVTWLVDEWGRMEPQESFEMEDEFGLYDIINDENFVVIEEDDLAKFPELTNILYDNLEDPDFRSLENISYLNIDNYWYYDSYYPDFSNPIEVVKSFLSSYLSNTAMYKELLGFSASQKLEINLDDDIPASIKDYKNLEIFVINTYDNESYEIPVMICLDGEIKGERYKEISELRLRKIDDRWYVINIYNGWLSYLNGKILSDIE